MISENGQAPDADFLFSAAPVSLWEEDFTTVKTFLEHLHSEGVLNLADYFARNPEAVIECARKVRVRSVNQATLALYEAKDQAQLLGSLEQTFTAESYAGFAQELVELDQGKHEVVRETSIQSLEGKHLDVIIRVTIAPGHEARWDQVLVSMTDISLLKAAEQKFQTLIDYSPVGLFLCDVRGNTIYLNARCAELVGVPAEQALNLDWLPLIHPDDRQRVATRWQAAVDEARSFREEYRWLHADGKVVWTRDVIRPVRSSQGEVVQYIGVLIDISERKQAEQALARQHRLALLRGRCNKALLEISEMAAYFTKVCQIIVEQGGYRLAWVGQARENVTKQVEPVADYGCESGYLESLQISWADDAFGQGPTGTAIREAKPCIAHDIAHDPRFVPWQQSATRYGYQSSIALPLYCDQVIWGALNIYVEHKNAFDETEVQLLHDLASELSYGIAVLRDREQQRHTEQMLYRYQHILSSTTEMMAMLNSDFVYLAANDAYLKAFDKTLEQLVGLSVIDVFGQEFFDRVIRPHGERCLAREEVHFTTWAQYPAFGRCFIDVHHSPYLDADDRVAGIVMSVRNITELKQEQDKYRALFDHVGIAILTHDLDGNILEVNHQAENLFGYDLAEWRKLKIADLHPPQALEVSKRAFQTIQKQGQVQFETEFVDKHGRMFPAEVYSTIIELGSQTVVQGTILDISERRENEQAKQQLLQQTRQIVDTARDAFVSMDASGLITDWNPMAEEMFGWTREQVLGRSMSDTLIARKQRAAHRQGLAHFLATGTGRINEHRMTGTAVHCDGHTFQVEISVAGLLQDGKTQFHAFIHDLSNRVRSQAALQEALFGTIHAVSNAIEARDPYTAGHQQRVAQLARAIGQVMGLPHEQLEGIRMGASIHDLGKIQLPAEILSKPTALLHLEYEIIKEHARNGYNVVKDVVFPWPVADIILQHHERLDGSGYPQGLRGEAILLEARIVAVADVVEAMASHRPYRPALGIELALAEIDQGCGRLYDAAVVAACLQIFQDGSFHFQEPA